MLVAMTKARIIGPVARLEAVLEGLYALRLVQLEDVAAEPELAVEPPPGAGERTLRRDELRVLDAQLAGLLDLTSTSAAADDHDAADVDLEAVRAQVRTLAGRVEQLTGRIDDLSAEEVVLGRYLAVLDRLLEAVPELPLIDAELPSLRLGTNVLVLSSRDEGVVEVLREALRLTLGARFLLASSPVPDGIGCVLLYPLDAAAEVSELLANRRVREMPLPEDYRSLGLRDAVAAMRRRLRDIPHVRRATHEDLDALLAPHAPGWRRARAVLGARLEQLDAVARAGVTDRAFVVAAWLPRSEVPRLRSELARRIGRQVVVEEVPASDRDHTAPVLLRNPRPAKPFEPLVRFYDDPRARSLDPTGLMALFVPLMFGLMVGDVGYGALLLALALWGGHRFGARAPIARDGARVLAAGSAWAIVFGIVFGEFLGDLGVRAFGMPALWRHRDEAEALQPLLLMTVAIGAAHVVLGFTLGLWQAWRDRSRQDALAPAGSLLVLAALFAVAAIAAEQLPASALGPAGVVAIVGLVVMAAAGGSLGAVVAPLQVVGMIGHVLSYLRLGAVGLASTYLAVVANEMASVGPIWIGVVVAAFLHALNLVLAGFTPAIQSLRLQYVEFFSKFFVGGGRAFEPFGKT